MQDASNPFENLPQRISVGKFDPAYTQGTDPIPFPPPDVDNPPPVISSLPTPAGVTPPNYKPASLGYDPSKETVTPVDISGLANQSDAVADIPRDKNGVPTDLLTDSDAPPPQSGQGTTAAQGVANEMAPSPANAATQGSGDADLDQLQSSIVRSKMSDDKRIGSMGDVANAFNENLLRATSYLIQISGVESAFESTIGAPTNPNGTAKQLDQLGQQFINDPNKAYMQADEMLQAMGINPASVHGFTNTYASDAGKLVWDSIATSMLTFAGASRFAVNAAMLGEGLVSSSAGPVSNAIAMAARKYAQAAAANPGMYIATELLGSIFSTGGAEKAGDYAVSQGAGPFGQAGAELMGGMSGGLIGGGGAFLTVKTNNGTIRVSRYFMGKIADAVDEIASHFGAQNKPVAALGQKVPLPTVDPDILNDARAKETIARDASANVVSSRVHRDQQVPGTAEHNSSSWAMQAAMQYEKEAHATAEAAWDKLPSEVRGPYSYQQQAIRSQFADTAYPQHFAEAQVQGEQAIVNSQIEDVFRNLSPTDISGGVPGASRRLSDGLWKMRAMAKGRLAKYWNRAPLKKPMPNRDILKSLDGFQKSLSSDGFNEKHIPGDEMDRLRAKFGNIKEKPPTLGWMKNFMTGLHEEANRLYASGNNVLASNYDKLHSLMYNVIDNAFPDNIPLQQARAASKSFFDLFSRSELGAHLASTKGGGTVIHPEDTLGRLMQRNRSFSDMQTAVKWLDKGGAFPTNIKDPDRLSKSQVADLKKLQDDASQGIKAYIEQYIRQQEGDPEKVRRMISDPTFQARIAPLGKVAGEVRQASKDLKDLIERREMVEKSAFAKYMQGDPDVALDKVWTSNDPKMADALMSGSAGLGGFKQDPIAMQGFKAGIIDRFVSGAGMDPTEMQSALAQVNTSSRKVSRLSNMLDGPKGRLLKAVLSPQEFERFTSLVNRAVAVSNESIASRAQHRFRTVLAEMASLKALHWMPEFLRAGEGGSLKQASLVSGLAHDVAERLMSDLPASEMFKRAIVNPDYEASLYQRIPSSTADAKHMASVIHRAATFERMMWATYGAWTGYANGPSAPDEKEETDSPLSWITPSSAHAGEVVPLPLYPGMDTARRASMENLKSEAYSRNPGTAPDAMNKAFDGYFGGGAKVIPIGPQAK